MLLPTEARALQKAVLTSPVLVRITEDALLWEGDTALSMD